MAYVRKTEDMWCVIGREAEVMSAYASLELAREGLRDYRKNAPGSYFLKLKRFAL